MIGLEVVKAVEESLTFCAKTFAPHVIRLYTSFLDELNKNDMFWTIIYFIFFLRSKGMCKDSVNVMSECEIVEVDCYLYMIEQRIKEC